jgi:alanyl-tRNA synthetase
MTSNEIRDKFLQFFKERGHTVVPSSSLIPDDPSVLLTTAGMQQFKPYYSELDPITTTHPSIGKPVGKNAASIQKSFRTSDIDEVGDESHLTFFEMLGNFSFGGYFKEEAITYGYDFITGTDWMGLDIEYVTIFDPDKVPLDDWRKGVPFDEESYQIWKKIGLPEEKIRRDGVDVFWGPTGNEGPCGPTTEIYVKNAEGKPIEIWNIVFNEFYRDKNMKLTPLKTPGVDTGMGLERLAMVSQKTSSIFETDLFIPLIQVLELNDKANRLNQRTKRIMADHARGMSFLIADGVRPSNKEAGYVLRRLCRRFIVNEYLNEGMEPYFERLLHVIVENYGAFYGELDYDLVDTVFNEEKAKFMKTIANGLRELKSIETLDAPTAFKLFESFGLPYEVVKELGGTKAEKLTREDFEKEFDKHREISRAGVEKKFGGHGLILDTGELKAGNEEELKKVTRLHTATHLMQQALREVLGTGVHQMGSDITPERTRFDFSFDRKLTPEEIKHVEDKVSAIVRADYDVKFQEMARSEAEKTGALHFFKAKYPDQVKVYYVTPKGKGIAEAWSKEFCGGPHVTHTEEIGTFRIAKEEGIAQGVRRIRAVVE